MTAHVMKDGWIGVVKGRPQAGACAERSRRTGFADVEAFTDMTGDRNPLHYDKAQAEASVFGRRARICKARPLTSTSGSMA